MDDQVLTGGSVRSVDAGWLVDPTGYHDQRFWDGTAWTEHVMIRGTQSTDILTSQPGPPRFGEVVNDGPAPPAIVDVDRGDQIAWWVFAIAVVLPTVGVIWGFAKAVRGQLQAGAFLIAMSVAVSTAEAILVAALAS